MHHTKPKNLQRNFNLSTEKKSMDGNKFCDNSSNTSSFKINEALFTLHTHTHMYK